MDSSLGTHALSHIYSEKLFSNARDDFSVRIKEIWCRERLFIWCMAWGTGNSQF